MTATKFGLAELEKYEAEVGFKKGDVRTIKGVCAIVDLPVTVVPEVKDVIATINKDVIEAQSKITKIETAEAKAEQVLKDNIAKMKAERETEKAKSKRTIESTKTETKTSNSEVTRLEKLLKNFS